MIGQAEFHCRCYAQGLVDATSVVKGDVEHDGMVHVYQHPKETEQMTDTRRYKYPLQLPLSL